jgi:hypothetical protein
MPSKAELARRVVAGIRGAEYVLDPACPERSLVFALLLRGAHVLDFMVDAATPANPMLGLAAREVLESAVNALYVHLDPHAGARELAASDRNARTKIAKVFDQEARTQPALAQYDEFIGSTNSGTFKARLEQVLRTVAPTEKADRLYAVYTGYCNFHAHGSFAVAGNYMSSEPLALVAVPDNREVEQMLEMATSVLGLAWEVVLKQEPKYSEPG